MDNRKPLDSIERFSPAVRLGHWSHAISVVALLLTGLALVFRGFGATLGSEGLKFFQQIHHFMAYPFTCLTLLILVFGAPRATAEWLKECFTWTKSDWSFIRAYPAKFFGLKATLPEQGKYNAGQKLNSILTIIGFLIMIITGWPMLYPAKFSPTFVAWSRPIHSLGAMVLGAVLIGHAYLALLHPYSRESIQAMVKGRISMEYARSHHSLWIKALFDDKQRPPAV
ncbi:formate dehydrogenase subunit gamma [Neomoorella humiferrea]|uniref:Formate dehydrogenase, cytochrome b556(Fdo) subunit n=1 Tax=Neomoorella humiferrea TaxID=676965 RepID=A0A2T0AWF0_9FIRM|nr:cytochrome b/b6 domain-containing protein [Moorella humiferrea]PRR75043.1 Formate dehydrogenase, cytochrome b556(fdo) subunit [Moorella humiferrea]